VLALEYLLDHGETITVNLGTGVGVSVRRMIEVARNVTGRPVAVHDAPRRSGDPSVLVADPTKASELLGWRPQRSDPAISSVMLGDGIENAVFAGQTSAVLCKTGVLKGSSHNFRWIETARRGMRLNRLSEEQLRELDEL
jgi:GDP-D-mannose dehydratase